MILDFFFGRENIAELENVALHTPHPCILCIVLCSLCVTHSTYAQLFLKVCTKIQVKCYSLNPQASLETKDICQVIAAKVLNRPHFLE